MPQRREAGAQLILARVLIRPSPDMQVTVEVHTDEGLSGLGETFRTPKAIAAQIHETVAPYLLGKNPLAIDSHSNVLLNPYLGFASSSVETRAASAIDIALWDLWGKGARPSGPRAAGWPLA